MTTLFIIIQLFFDYLIMGPKLRSDDDTLEKLMESKLEGFKSSLINELTQNIKIIIADEIKKTLGEYQQKIEQCTSTITMLQNQIISLKEVNQKMRKDNEAQFKKVESLAEENQQYGRRLCLRVKNLEKKVNETPDSILDSLRLLFEEEEIDIPDNCLDRAHRVSRNNDTVIVRFTTFRHRTLLYKKRKEIKERKNISIHLDLTKDRLNMLLAANDYVKNLPNVSFAYADINCRLKVRMSNDKEFFFISMEDLINQVEGVI